MEIRLGWRSFVSSGTLVSGLLAASLAVLQWGWVTGILVVVLLYAHEAGHVLAAAWRRMPVRRAPVFLPGFGAFVVTGTAPRPWDQVWVSLGGPLLGTAAALAVWYLGHFRPLPAVGLAGAFMVYVNLFNLLPFGLLDGGQVIRVTGWLGLVPTAFFGGWILARDREVFLPALILLGLWQAVREAQVPRPATLGLRAAVLTLYGATALVTLLAASFTGVPWLPEALPAGGLSVTGLIFLIFLVYLVSGVVIVRVFQPGHGARVRYLSAALAGWPRYLVEAPHLLPVMACLAAHLLGLPGLTWLRRLLGAAARRHDPVAGAAAAHGYDCLVLQGHEAAAGAWLAGAGPLLQAAGFPAQREAHRRLAELEYAKLADTWLLAALHWPDPPADLPPAAANTLAWVLWRRREYAAALPLARQAVAAAPADPVHLDTLARVLISLGQPAEAEPHAWRALEGGNHPRIRLTLARALAAQGRYREAVAQGERALADLPGHRAAAHLDLDRVERWLASWRQSAAADPTPPRYGEALTRALPVLAVVAAAGLGFLVSL